jgi:mannosyl-oligosaccharide glucosidase
MHTLLRPDLALLLLSVSYVIATGTTTAAVEASLRWGPYRPNLYFGIRPTTPRTLLAGLMWGGDGSQEDKYQSTTPEVFI